MNADEQFRILNKLAKWRKVFASWQLGTRLDTDGEYKAVADHREVTILLRVELNALATLLVQKGVFTADEWDEAMAEEARDMDAVYQERFPGFSVTEGGMHLKMPQALETMRRLGFPK